MFWTHTQKETANEPQRYFVFFPACLSAALDVNCCTLPLWCTLLWFSRLGILVYGDYMRGNARKRWITAKFLRCVRSTWKQKFLLTHPKTVLDFCREIKSDQRKKKPWYSNISKMLISAIHANNVISNSKCCIPFFLHKIFSFYQSKVRSRW